MLVREGAIGRYPCLIAGDGPTLVVLAGLSPDVGVAPGPMRRMHEQALRPWTDGHRAFYINRRPGLPIGLSMRTLAADHAVAIADTFGEPVDVLGLSTGGSIAQQLAADHPAAVGRLVLISTACRLGRNGRSAQRRIAARVRAGAARQALAVAAAELVPPWRGRHLAAAVAWTVGARWFRAEDLNDMATTIEAEDEFDLARCPTIRSRTLLIAGGRDRFYEPELFEETARLIPGCRLSLHPGRGHITVTATPRTVAEALGFLSADVPGRS
ncbi:MAG TPA: alpha/beta fold hydrolase [Solirubrobacteraceae bacterium]|nr:alpha/beta fold hydrolase [Solirubrobacteraceae bacterium]